MKRLSSLMRNITIDKSFYANNEYIKLWQDILKVEKDLCWLKQSIKRWEDYGQEYILMFTDRDWKVSWLTKKIDIPIKVWRELAVEALEKYLDELKVKYDSFSP